MTQRKWGVLLKEFYLFLRIPLASLWFWSDFLSSGWKEGFFLINKTFPSNQADSQTSIRIEFRMRINWNSFCLWQTTICSPSPDQISIELALNIKERFSLDENLKSALRPLERKARHPLLWPIGGANKQKKRNGIRNTNRQTQTLTTSSNVN